MGRPVAVDGKEQAGFTSQVLALLPAQTVLFGSGRGVS